MLVFGDLESIEPARKGLEGCAARFRAALDLPAGAGRHASLVNAYVETSRLAQGCVDAQFAREGCDALNPVHEAAIAALCEMAGVLATSWRKPAEPACAFDGAALSRLIALAPEETIHARVAEGFAFYALYPEACLAGPREEHGERVVIGVRSIGMALAPLLAEALDASLCVTLRPVGHPFARACALSPGLAETLRNSNAAQFHVIDEGPGLSGSSFGAVADALESIGVPPASIVFHPSHANPPGSAASPAQQRRWSSARKLVLDSAPAIERALASFAIVRDLSGGAWREDHASSDAPANRPYERQKFLAQDASGCWLVKFVGLGDIAERKVAMAYALSQAGFAPPAGAASEGFLAQRWIADVRPLAAAPRARIIERIAAYIAFRAKNLAALPYGGADIATLHDMARCNIAEGMGEDAAALLDRFVPRLKELERLERRIATDNRMHAWEWLWSGSAGLIKCDSIDHCAGHDLIGCRDPAWDVAGVVVEFDLAERETGELLALLDDHGAAIAPPLLDFFLPAYCAFNLGAAAMAADANAQWPQDARRWRVQKARYAMKLTALLRDSEASRARSRSGGAPQRALPR